MQNEAPLKIDLACGMRPSPGFVGVDIWEGADIVRNLEQFPWPFEDDSVDEIFCCHYIEHVPDLVSFANELYRIMKPGATAHLVAPYYSSIRAWQDPTHVRAISENTFCYFRKDWRTQASLEHYPMFCDFDVLFQFVYAEPWLEGKSEEELAFARRHYMNVVEDIHVLLTKKGPASATADDQELAPANFQAPAPEPSASASQPHAAEPKQAAPQRVLDLAGEGSGSLPRCFADWQCDLVDPDPAAGAALCCDLLELSQTQPRVYDAVHACHSLQRYHWHELPALLGGLRLVLKKDGFVLIQVPDLRRIMLAVAEGELDLQDELYRDDSGPVRVNDAVYGAGRSAGHKSGFSESTLARLLTENGFAHVFLAASSFGITALAFKLPPSEAQREQLQMDRMEMKRWGLP